MVDTPWAPEIMAEGADLLDSTGLAWWLECGALLGIYREGKLLDHDDPDIDVTVLGDHDPDALQRLFEDHGFVKFARGPHQLVMLKRQVLFDISFYELDGEDLVMKVIRAGEARQPYALFNPLGEIEFMGRKYPTTNDVEAYLEQRYGDWRTPKTQKHPWTHPGETLVWKSE